MKSARLPDLVLGRSHRHMNSSQQEKALDHRSHKPLNERVQRAQENADGVRLPFSVPLQAGGLCGRICLGAMWRSGENSDAWVEMQSGVPSRAQWQLHKVYRGLGGEN